MPAGASKKTMVWVFLVATALVWLVGIYLLYRASMLDGRNARGAFAIGLLMVICSSAIAICSSVLVAAYRSHQAAARQAAAREERVHDQIRCITEHVREVDRRLERLEDRAAARRHADVLRAAINQADDHSRRLYAVRNDDS